MQPTGEVARRSCMSCRLSSTPSDQPVSTTLSSQPAAASHSAMSVARRA
ncbi:MAG: hypothetical protein U1F49_07830 [Rubrivivax sp.]